MKLYMAPMEGVTGYVYRRAYHACFYPMDRCITPFIAPKQAGRPEASGAQKVPGVQGKSADAQKVPGVQGKSADAEESAGLGTSGGRLISISTRERNDILPQHNEGLRTIPQILTNKAEDFLQTASLLKTYGYREVNLNLGCPSRTVTAKGKGAGFLEFPDKLEEFLLEVSRGMEELEMGFSVKTRLGVEAPQEFERLLEIYNRVPLTELILHPRVLKDYYGNKPRLEWVEKALSASRALVCYNGDIFSVRDFKVLTERFPAEDTPGKKGLNRVMLGRGLIRNPGLGGELMGLGPASIEQLARFHSLVYEGYRQVMDERSALFKMKELWSYMISLFDAESRLAKKLKKAKNEEEYLEAVRAIFEAGVSEGEGAELTVHF